MHTVKVIFGGIFLLGVCLLVERWIGGAAATVDATTIKYFLVLWLVATLVNMWVGVSKAGYSIKDEAPIALLVFAVPAIVAIVIMALDYAYTVDDNRLAFYACLGII
jgi:hypothetical protein